MSHPSSPLPSVNDRSTLITRAREAVLLHRQPQPSGLAPWVAQSWQRCLASGLSPAQRLGFEVVSRAAIERAMTHSQPLLQAARPVIRTLAQAVADTRYFALLTNAQGIVIDVEGAIDLHDPRAAAIARLGVDLSEQAVGTTAIGATLAELKPVWLHRGEHFFEDTSVYSCAGAPVMGPDGCCVGMLDLTGILVAERPALRHLLAQSARRIENALVQACHHHLLLRLGWPGQAMGSDNDGLLVATRDGRITGHNPAATDMLGLADTPEPTLESVFAVNQGLLFDLTQAVGAPREVPLWSGLRLQVVATRAGTAAPSPLPAMPARPEVGPGGPLREVEDALIRRTVQEWRGNVAAAAKALGISRATVYRKLGKKPS